MRCEGSVWTMVADCCSVGVNWVQVVTSLGYSPEMLKPRGQYGLGP